MHHRIRQSCTRKGFSTPLPFARLGHKSKLLGRPQSCSTHERIDKLRHVLSERECDDKKTSDQERIKPMHICCLLSFNHLFRQPSLEKVYCKAKKKVIYSRFYFYSQLIILLSGFREVNVAWRVAHLNVSNCALRRASLTFSCTALPLSAAEGSPLKSTAKVRRFSCTAKFQYTN